VTGQFQWLTGRTPSENDYSCIISGASGIVAAPVRIEALAMRNRLFCGDNLEVLRLREYFPDECVDLVYLDPPFKSDQNYNLLFREKDGSKSTSQILAFEDTWEWNLEAQRNYESVVQMAGKLGQVMAQFRTMLGETDMLAYLSMMAPRLVELQRVLRSTGSIYLHCDPTASHYLKTLMDGIFGPENFINEVTWKRSDAKGDASGQGAKHFGRVNDMLLLYAKRSGQQVFHPQFIPMKKDYIKRWYRHTDPDGRRYKLDNMLGPGGAAKGNPEYEVMGVKRFWRYSRDHMQQLIERGRVVQTRAGAVPMYKRYLDESKGVPVTSNWADIRPIHGWAAEKLGYPTQKPQALLERIISASSNDGDIILDPFCGCGTAIEAAHKLRRHWIGIDITIQAMRVIRNERIPKFGADYDVIYRPCDLNTAEAFATEQPFNFQDWAVEKLEGIPSRPRSGDRGIDGRLYFREDNGRLQDIIVSVKGGKLKSTFVRELQGAVARERKPMGVLITLKEPSKQMIRDAASSGFYNCQFGSYPKIQIITVKDILDEVRFKLPPIQRMDDMRKRTLAVAAESQMPLPGIAG
jgi:DNA modification methylase